MIGFSATRQTRFDQYWAKREQIEKEAHAIAEEYQSGSCEDVFANFDAITGQRIREDATAFCDDCARPCDELAGDSAVFCCICRNQHNYVPLEACERCQTRRIQ